MLYYNQVSLYATEVSQGKTVANWPPLLRSCQIFNYLFLNFSCACYLFSDACMNKHHKTTLFWKIKTIQMKVSNICYVAIFTDFGP